MNLASPSQALGMSAQLRVLIIDDHELVSDGLKVALQQHEPDIQIETALTCQSARTLLEQDQNFDLILLDLSLPDNRGMRFLRQLQEMRLLIPVAILSASEDPEDVDHALAGGACGFICKSTSGACIYQAIISVLQGKVVTPDFYRRHMHRRKDPLIDINAITPRQMEVLQLLSQGLPNKKICQALNLTEDTVKSHLKSLFMHLNVHNRTECVRVAAKWNLID